MRFGRASSDFGMCICSTPLRSVASIFAINEGNSWGHQSLDVQFALQLRDATYEATRAVPAPVVVLVPPD